MLKLLRSIYCQFLFAFTRHTFVVFLANSLNVLNSVLRDSLLLVAYKHKVYVVKVSNEYANKLICIKDI